LSDNPKKPDDPLEVAVTAFREMAVPDRPPDAGILAQLATVSRGTSPKIPISPSLKRRYLMRLVVPSAAALILLGSTVVFLLTATPSPTLADVAKAADKYKLVKYKQVQTTDTNNMVGASTESTVYADLKALRARSESLNRFQDPDDRAKIIEEVNLSIQDAPKGRHLMTNTHPGGKVLPPRRDAWLGRAGGAKTGKSFLENLREFQREKGVTSGKDKLDGVETIKYRLEEDKQTVSLWVDAKTRLPVRMEQEFTDPTPDITRNKFVWTDFEWDPNLPKGFKNLDALFDTTPPKDYTLTDESKKDNDGGSDTAKPALPPEKK
jgi:hypothetical protein